MPQICFCIGRLQDVRIFNVRPIQLFDLTIDIRPKIKNKINYLKIVMFILSM